MRAWWQRAVDRTDRSGRQMLLVGQNWFSHGVHRRFVVSLKSRNHRSNHEGGAGEDRTGGPGCGYLGGPKDGASIGATLAETGTKKGMNGPGAKNCSYVRLIES